MKYFEKKFNKKIKKSCLSDKRTYIIFDDDVVIEYDRRFYYQTFKCVNVKLNDEFIPMSCHDIRKHSCGDNKEISDYKAIRLIKYYHKVAKHFNISINELENLLREFAIFSYTKGKSNSIEQMSYRIEFFYNIQMPKKKTRIIYLPEKLQSNDYKKYFELSRKGIVL